MRLRSVIKKLGISLASLVVCGLVAELVFRALEPGPLTLWDSRPYRSERFSTVHGKEVDMVLHKPGFSGQWDGSHYAINSLGMRGPEAPAPSADERQLRILCLGDSCTFGKGVAERDCWPRQLETRLAAMADGRWRPVVGNAGTNGYSGLFYEMAFRRLEQAFEPDVVLVGYNINDFPNAIMAVDRKLFYTGETAPARDWIPKGLRDSMAGLASYRFARSMYYHLRRSRDWANAENFAKGSDDLDLESPTWQRERDSLSAIRERANARGARMAVALFPYESQVYLDTFDDSPILRMREVCEQLDIAFIDLNQAFRSVVRQSEPAPQLFLRGDRYHPRGAGYGIVADRIASALSEWNWLPQREAGDVAGGDGPGK